MVAFQDTSILYGLDEDDAQSIRRVMSGTIQRLAGVSAEALSHQQNLNSVELSIVEQIVAETTDNEPFRAAALRFASAHTTNSATVLRVAQEFELITPPTVLGPANLRVAEHVALVASIFQDFVDNGLPFDYTPDSPTASRKRKRDDTEDEEEGDAEEDLESGSDSAKGEDAVQSSKGKKEARDKKIKHRPKKPRGYNVIDDGQDRHIRAEIGKPDASLLKLTFNGEKEDSKTPGKVTRKSYSYDFVKDVNPNFSWDSERDVAALNKWRDQILLRNLGSTRDARHVYTIAEQNELFRLLSTNLRTVEVGGRYSHIQWNDVAAQLNAIFEGRVFEKTDTIAETEYPTKGNKAISLKHPPKVHTYVPRNGTGIRNIMDHFTHKKAKRIVADAKAADWKYWEDYLKKSAAGGGEITSDPGEATGDKKDPDSKKPASADDYEDETNNEPKGKGRHPDFSESEFKPEQQEEPESEAEEDESLAMALRESRRDHDRDGRNQKSGGESSNAGAGSSSNRGGSSNRA